MTNTARTSTPQLGPIDLWLLVFLGAVWGAAYLFIRVASPEVGPLWTAEIRIGLAAAVLLAIAGRRTLAAARGRIGAFFVVGAAFSAIPFSLISFAALTLPAGFGALLNSSTPLFTAVVAAAWLGQRLTVRTVSGLGFGVLAVLVLVGWSPLPLGPGTLVAVAAALAASFSYAIAGTFVRRTLPDVTGLELATGQLTTGAVLLLPFALISGPPAVPSIEVSGALLALALLSTALAWPIFFGVLRRNSPTVAMTVTFIVPAFGILWGALILAEPVGPELVAGFALIVMSLGLVARLPIPTAVLRMPVPWVRRRVTAAVG